MAKASRWRCASSVSKVAPLKLCSWVAKRGALAAFPLRIKPQSLEDAAVERGGLRQGRWFQEGHGLGIQPAPLRPRLPSTRTRTPSAGFPCPGCGGLPMAGQESGFMPASLIACFIQH